MSIYLSIFLSIYPSIYYQPTITYPDSMQFQFI